LGALWIFLPVIGAPLLHVWVLRGDLLRGLKRPLDGGLTFWAADSSGTTRRGGARS